MTNSRFNVIKLQKHILDFVNDCPFLKVIDCDLTQSHSP